MAEIDLMSWLPAQSRRMLADQQREDESQAREAKRARVARHEELANQAVAAAISEAAARGEVVSPVDAVNGRIGRTIPEILQGAQAEVADRVPQSLREPGPEWLGAGEPLILASRSATGLKIFSRARKFRDMLDARRQLAAAEERQRRAADDYGLVDGVTLHDRWRP